MFCKEIKDLLSSSSQNTSNQGTILSCPNREMGRKRQKKKENFVEVWYKMQNFSMCLETALKSILPHCSLILPILVASSVAKLLQEPLCPFCWCFSAPHLCDRFPSSCRRCTSLHRMLCTQLYPSTQLGGPQLLKFSEEGFLEMEWWRSTQQSCQSLSPELTKLVMSETQPRTSPPTNHY